MTFLFRHENRGNCRAEIGLVLVPAEHHSAKPRLKGNRQGIRPGFTLVEVLLVLSLMVVFGALAWPALRYPLANQRLRAAAEQIRVEWTRARLAAIKGQTPYVFRFVPGESRYTVEPWGSSVLATAPVQGGWDVTLSQGTAWDTEIAVTTAEKTLPEGVIFVGGTSERDTRAEAVVEEMTAVLGPGAFAWAEAIIFFPDGTATDAEVTLENDQGRQITVWLRGLTGVVQVGNITRSESSSFWGH
jgi:prepilin-type N-terminal cleavage/methylation domain-containing protein